MASAYFSSQSTIEAKVRSSRVKLWGDKNADGTLDPATLEQALIYAKQTILAYVVKRYGAQALDWTFDTCPPLLKAVSDDLTLFYLASGANAVNPVIELNQKNVLAMLTMLKDYELDLPGTDDSPAIETLTEDTESVFDDLLIDTQASTNPALLYRNVTR